MTAWHELVVEGAERTLRAFVSGFLAGCGEHTGGVFGSDVPLAGGSFGERGGELGLVVERGRVVESAKCSFRGEVFRATWQRRFALSPRCPPVCALSSDRKGGNASRGARSRAIRAAARVHLPRIRRHRRSIRGSFGNVAARANARIRGNRFAPFGRKNRRHVATVRVLPCSVGWSRSNQTATREGRGMPRQKSLVTAIRELVRKQVSEQIASLLGSIGGAGTMKRRRRRRGRRGPGRPPGSKTRRRRGRPPKTA